MVIDFLRVRFAHAFQCRSCFTQKEKNSCAGLFSSFPWIAGHLVTMDLELTAFVAGSLFDGSTIQPLIVGGACETSLVARSDERRLYSQASVTQTSVTPASVTQTSNSTVVLFTIITFTIEGCLDSKLISCTVFVV